MINKPHAMIRMLDPLKGFANAAMSIAQGDELAEQMTNMVVGCIMTRAEKVFLTFPNGMDEMPVLYVLFEKSQLKATLGVEETGVIQAVVWDRSGTMAESIHAFDPEGDLEYIWECLGRL